jgi:phosphoglycerate kinase
MSGPEVLARRPLGVPTLEDLGELAGRAVLVRGDLDIRHYDTASPAHRRRLDVLVPTVRWLLERGARVAVCGHHGDAGEQPDASSFPRLREALEAACPGATVLPHLRAEAEQAGDQQLVADLVKGQDVFVNEAFQWCWLPLASLVGPPATLPAAAGLRLANDLELLAPLLSAPPRPFVVVFGSDQSLARLPGLRGLVLRADDILVGGAMALPFLQAIGARPTGGAQSDLLRECRACFGLAREIQHDIRLPSDLIWEQPDGSTLLTPSGAPVEGVVSDIGPTTRLRFAEILRGAGSILWTGALGRAEDARFAAGTRSVAASLPAGAHVVLGGDALFAALEGTGVLEGGAGMLSATESAVALLKDGDLPALAALRGDGRRPA